MTSVKIELEGCYLTEDGKAVYEFLSPVAADIENTCYIVKIRYLGPDYIEYYSDVRLKKQRLPLTVVQYPDGYAGLIDYSGEVKTI